MTYAFCNGASSSEISFNNGIKNLGAKILRCVFNFKFKELRSFKNETESEKSESQNEVHERSATLKGFYYFHIWSPKIDLMILSGSTSEIRTGYKSSNQ